MCKGPGAGGLWADLFWMGRGAGGGSRDQRTQDLGCKAWVGQFIWGHCGAMEGFKLGKNKFRSGFMEEP